MPKRQSASLSLWTCLESTDVLPPPLSPLPQPSRDHFCGVQDISDQEANPHALVPSGTLTSITNLATSLARNMDRLSLDEEHYSRQEEWRRQLPESLGEGLRQGLSRLGISLLGKGLPGPCAHVFPGSASRAGAGREVHIFSVNKTEAQGG